MDRMYRLLPAILLACCGAAHAQAVFQSDGSGRAGGVKFRMAYPASLDKEGARGRGVVFSRAGRLPAGEPLALSVSVLPDGGVCRNLQEEDWEKLPLPAGSVGLSSTPTELNGQPALVREYEQARDGSRVRLRELLACAPSGGILQVNCFTPGPTAAVPDDYKRAFAACDAVLDSLRFLP